MAKHRRPKYLHVYEDRHGTERIYFNRSGTPKLALPGPLYSEEFWVAYRKAEASALPPAVEIGVSRTAPGSMSDLIAKYYKSPAFKSLKPSTQQLYRLQLDKFREKHGHRPVRSMERVHINAIMSGMDDRRNAANNLLKRLKVLMNFAVDIGMRRDNPLAGMRGFKVKGTGFHTWTEEEIARFEAHFPAGTKARLAMALMLYTGQRRSDAVRMGWQHICDNRITIRQQKTGTELSIPLHPRLRSVLDQTLKENMTFLVTEYGRPFTNNGFGNWMRDRCDEAGLPDCSSHGLRKAASRRLAEAGCTNQQIKAITGHESEKEVARYTKAAEQKRMADAAMEALQVNGTGTEIANQKPKVSKKRPRNP